jgi:hypothetical protein
MEEKVKRKNDKLKDLKNKITKKSLIPLKTKSKTLTKQIKPRKTKRKIKPSNTFSS